MSSSVSHLFAASEEHLHELPMSPYAIGGLAFVCFLALLGVLWFFRGSANKVAAGGIEHGDPQSTHH